MTKAPNCLKLILPLVLLLSFLPFITSTGPPKTPNIQEENPKDCMENGFYNCDTCYCAPAVDIPLALSLSISIISLLVSLAIFAGYLLIKEMREQPGDIVFAVAVCNIIFSGAYIWESVAENQDPFFSDGTAQCIRFGYLKALTYFLVHFYNMAFSMFFLVILRGSLKSHNIPFLAYHFFPLAAGVVVYYRLSALNAIGQNILGMCGIKTTSEFTFFVGFYSVVGLSTVILAWFTRQYLPKNDKISNLRNTFLRFYFKLVIVLVIDYLINGIIDVFSSHYVLKFINGAHDDAMVELLKKLIVSKGILLNFTSILLPAARILDPLMREHWKKMFYGCIYSYRRRRGATAIFDLGRVSLDVSTVQKQLEKRSYIFQFQHNRRIQVIYAVLSGIHCFWKIKSENMNKSRAGERSYKDRAHDKAYFPIDQRIMENTIPELYDEIKERDYDFSEGTFTAHAPEIFEKIIQLDEVGRSISVSLDLKENFKRILKCGINGGGKSGEFFFFSNDNKIIIKTISTSELNILIKILPSYLEHFEANPDSIIAKIYGVFTFQVRSLNERYHLILMRNINGIPSNYVRRKYDLKGSTAGRRAVKGKDVSIEELELIPNLKDLDFDRFEKRVHVSSVLSQALIETIKKDVAFLASQNLIDYSLALYLVDKRGFLNGGCSEEENRESLISMRSTQDDLYYHLGIIDYLISFNCKKKLEVFVRKLLACNPNHNISVQRPGFYGNRFVKYMEKIFCAAEEEEIRSQGSIDNNLSNKLL